ncbi:hypothetical protein Pmani_018931 [Petrolisthes manimaculis]|uniref:Reverse transcriptase domain-containing protein n=1 Tax=Petrolisthes manimaculis TaxID=1843537 RepID=A0AAE1PLH1_9EUCA|nr:hypothetical protein Pmani_018931 [Petrolisthes manimaculis]
MSPDKAGIALNPRYNLRLYLHAYNLVTLWYDQGSTVDLILFDFVKAFDRVHHQTLLDKLQSVGISGNLLQWNKSFLLDRSMRVSIGGSLSNNVPITSGVPQGSVLGPLLFLIYVNYIGSSLTCKYMMFADDLKLFLHNPGDPSSPASAILQFNIDTLAATASSWGLKFAPGKCVHLCFRRGLGGPFNHEYYLDGIALNQASSHKDLGVMVDNKLRFHPHIRQTMAGAGGVASNLLKSTVCRSLSFMKTLFISDVRPLLDFASPVWNTGFLGDMRLLESVQRRWTKQVGDMIVSVALPREIEEAGPVLYKWKTSPFGPYPVL